MKRQIPKVRSLAFSLLFIMLSAGDCDEKMNVGYHYVPIQTYDITDYARMLGNPNPEIQYNAICALHELVDVKYLDEDSFRHTPEHNRDLAIYNSIYPMMDSGNSWISSAAVRYAGKYAFNRRAYLEHSLNNNNPSINVQLAIWDNFRTYGSESQVDSNKLARKIDFCFNHPSWLVRQCVYDYITPQVAHQYEKKLWNEYRQTGEQYKRLQALAALGNHMCDTTLNLMELEYERTQDAAIRTVIVALITIAPDKAHVLRWFRDRPSETIHALQSGFNFWNDTSNFYPRLLTLALNQGMDPLTLKETSYSGVRTDEYPILFELLFNHKYNSDDHPAITTYQKATLDLLEEKIASNPEMQTKWMAYASAKPRFYLPEALIREQLKITESYNRALSRLYDKYNADSSLYNTYIESLPSLYSALTKKRTVKAIR